MIVIIGKVTIQPDTRELFLNEVNLAAGASQKEAEVSRYELVQSVGEPNTFLLIEEYADEAALASHTKTEHLQRLMAKIGAMLAGPPAIKKYIVTSTEMM